MKYMPKELARELREKLDLVRDPSYSELIFREDIRELCKLFAQSRKKRAIRKNAQIHSFRIENPSAFVPYSVPTNSRRIKKGVKKIETAFNWGVENFDPEKFDEDFIKNIAGRILYGKGLEEYRNTGTRITGASVTPPYPYKFKTREMPEFVENLRRQFKCPDIIQKIEAGIYTHLLLVRIHPFVDGNGRTARTLQDIILDYHNIPLPIIESGERNTYYQLLDRAIVDMRDKESIHKLKKNGATEGEYMFYTFIAGKINSSLDCLIEQVC